MEISVSLWSYHHFIESKEMTIEDCIKHMHKNGVNAVELLDVYAKTTKELQDQKRLIEELNMKVASFSITNNFVVDEDERINQVTRVQNSCKYAHMFNTNIVRVFCANMNDKFTYDEGLIMILKSF